MKTRILLIACILSLSTTAMADEVKLTNPKKLFPAEKITNRMRMYPLFAARLNPTGTHLIYPNMIPATPPDYKTSYEMKVLNIKTAKENALTLSLPGGYESVYTRINFFNPAGDKLAMGRFQKGDQNRQTDLVIYDLDKDKLVSTGLKGPNLLAMFDYTGKYLYTLGSGNNKVDLADFTSTKTPMPGWIHTPSPYSPYTTVFATTRQPDQRKPKVSFQLWNLETEKMIKELPVHEKNSSLDDISAQWTKDGRYVYYMDYNQDASKKNLTSLTRVWDVEKNCQIAEIVNAMSAGPGPTKTTMLMVEADGPDKGRMFLHDAQKDEIITFAPTKARPIHTCGNKLLYISSDSDAEMVYIADISIATKDENE